MGEAPSIKVKYVSFTFNSDILHAASLVTANGYHSAPSTNHSSRLHQDLSDMYRRAWNPIEFRRSKRHPAFQDLCVKTLFQHSSYSPISKDTVHFMCTILMYLDLTNLIITITLASTLYKLRIPNALRRTSWYRNNANSRVEDKI